jgi:glycosyltransferase involved in cell wall biosynthesis
MGWAAARCTGARFVYYPFELFGEQHYTVSRFWAKVERWLLRRGVDALITQNESRAGIYTQERGARVTPVIVHNYKPMKYVRARQQLRSLAGLRDDCRVVLYEGILQVGRSLDRLIESAQLLPPDTYLVLMGDKLGWWFSTGAPMLKNGKLAERVRVVPPVAHNDVIGYCADADVGVVIYDDKVRNNYYCSPGKLSDYVMAGVPVIAPDFPTIGPLIRELGIGETFASDAPAEIAAAISRVLEKPKALWQDQLKVASGKLAWETQERVFLSAVMNGKVNYRRGAAI